MRLISEKIFTLLFIHTNRYYVLVLLLCTTTCEEGMGSSFLLHRTCMCIPFLHSTILSQIVDAKSYFVDMVEQIVECGASSRCGGGWGLLQWSGFPGFPVGPLVRLPLSPVGTSGVFNGRSGPGPRDAKTRPELLADLHHDRGGSLAFSLDSHLLARVKLVIFTWV